MRIRLYIVSNQTAIDIAVKAILKNGYRQLKEYGEGCQLSRINGLQIPVFQDRSGATLPRPGEAEVRSIFEREGQSSFQLRTHLVERGKQPIWGLCVVIRNDCNNEAYVLELQENESQVFPDEPLKDEIFSVAWFVRWHQRKLVLDPMPEGLPDYVQSVHSKMEEGLRTYQEGVWYVKKLSGLHALGSSKVPMAWAEECFVTNACVPESYPWLAGHPEGDPIGRELKKLFEANPV